MEAEALRFEVFRLFSKWPQRLLVQHCEHLTQRCANSGASANETLPDRMTLVFSDRGLIERDCKIEEWQPPSFGIV
jgi:hypothetical protein